MQKIVVGNLKMNLTNDEIKKYLNFIDKEKFDNSIILALPYTYLYLNNEIKNKNILLSSQNYYLKNKGSYTGEISPMMIKSMNINYSIIGHYERKRYFYENYNIINEKVIIGLENNLNLILCVSSLSKLFLKHELNKIFLNVKKQDIDKIIIAYEPNNMIGTNKDVNYDFIENMTLFIKGYFKKEYNKTIKVLYGGSINDNNILKLYEKTSVDGVLVGNAALNCDKFLKIIRAN